MSNPKPTVAVYKFSSCDGCQLSILNMEDDLLDLAEAIDIAFFLEATRAERPGPYDIAIVEGSVTTPHEIERIKEVRRQAKILIALGTCATAGGIQALRNFANADEYAKVVYPHPEYLHYLKTATPIAEHVKVDLELWGCPVNKEQVLEVIAALLNNRKPSLPAYSVCLECKRRGTVCVLVDKGFQCLGPATQAGCGAICPVNGRGCYGCFGPVREANLDSLSPILQKLEPYPGATARLFRGISGYAPSFRKTADALLSAHKETK
ncbi:MAG: oxidoreductase [Chloroflexi bacterium]|nr:oxidoreductase [Chloroflexota bacterium]